jgi:putative sigma-54 modulation protein
MVRVSEKKPNTRVDVDMPYLSFSIHAEAVTTDGVLGGIDKCMDILERQIAKYKTRMNKAKVKKSGLKKDILDIVPDDVLLAPETPEEEPAYKLVKKPNGKPQPMSMDEAVLQMEVLDYRFFVFYARRR